MSATIPTRRLQCACCGASVLGRQWWNRDKGFGVCQRCAKETIQREGEEATVRLYGRRGEHWSVNETELKRGVYTDCEE